MLSEHVGINHKTGLVNNQGYEAIAQLGRATKPFNIARMFSDHLRLLLILWMLDCKPLTIIIISITNVICHRCVLFLANLL